MMPLRLLDGRAPVVGDISSKLRARWAQVQFSHAPIAWLFHKPWFSGFFHLRIEASGLDPFCQSAVLVDLRDRCIESFAQLLVAERVEEVGLWRFNRLGEPRI